MLAVNAGGPGEFDQTVLGGLGNVSFATGSLLGIDTTNAPSGGLSYAGTIAGPMGLVKLGANALLLSGNNTYAGSTTVAAGILTLSGSVTSAGNTNLLGGQLDINNPNALGSGTLTITGGSLDNTSGGSITLATNNAQAWTGDFTFLGSNPLNLGTGSVTLAANRQVTVAVNSLTVGGNITGGYGLTVAGSGSLILGGSNTYTGATTVNSGHFKSSPAARSPTPAA